MKEVLQMIDQRISDLERHLRLTDPSKRYISVLPRLGELVDLKRRIEDKQKEKEKCSKLPFFDIFLDGRNSKP